MILALDKISKQLAVLEKKIAAQPTALLKPSTYADHARLTPSQVFYKKPVPGRALSEVMVKVVDDPKLSQTSGQLVESINAARSTKAGKVVAARKLESGDIVITADNEVTKNLSEPEEGWTKVIAGKTKVKARQFTVIAHGVRTNRIETTNQERALADLHSQNPLLKGKVRFLRVAWKKKTRKVGRLRGLLLIDVGMPEEANTLVREGLIHDHEPKNCNLFHSECLMTLCFRCQGYGHVAATCGRQQTCGICAKQYPTATCPTPTDP
jgi:hypothetical protein